MKPFKKICFLIIVFILVPPLIVFPKENIVPVIIDADRIDYLKGEGKVIARGNVKMRHKDTQLFCDRAEYDARKQIAHIKGKVKVIRGKTLLYGTDIDYDFFHNKAIGGELRVEDAPFYGEAKSGVRESKNKYIFNKGFITTCNLKDPHYRVEAKKIELYPDEKVVARNIVLKVGKIPLMYLPYFVHSLNEPFPLEFIPGKSKELGKYLLTRWRYHLGEQNRGRVVLDLYEERGMGGGLIHKFETNTFGEGFLNLYLIQDKLYRLQKRNSLFNDFYPERSSIPPKRLRDDRWRIQYSHKWQPLKNLSLRAEYNRFSDENFLKDFFEREFEIAPQLDSYILADYSLPLSSLSLLFQKRVNRFFGTTEYLPQLQFDFFRHTIGNSNFYWENKTLGGEVSSLSANSTDGSEAFRVHTNNTLSYQKKLLGWLFFNPYVSNHFTYYSRGPEDRHIFRINPSFGVNLSTKLYRIFELNTKSIDKIRHIITPTFTYNYTKDPIIKNSSVFQFDSIDNLSRSEKITFTLNNKLQAKKKDKVWDFLFFNPSIDYIIHQEGKGSFFDKINADLELYPREGISLKGDTSYDVPTRKLTDFNIDLSIRDPSKENKYNFSVGHRYVRKLSSQGTMSLEYQLSPKLRYRNYFRYEYQGGDLKEQQHSLRVDLHCWWMDLGINKDKTREGITDILFWVSFTLKGFPEVKVGFGKTYQGAKNRY